MRFRHTVRARVALLSGLVALIAGLFFFAAVFFQNERIERDLIETTLVRTLDGVLAAGRPVGVADLPADIRLYGPGTDSPPGFLDGLAPGMHEIEHGGRTFEVLVESHRGERYVMTYDETLNEDREFQLYLIAVPLVVLGVVVAAGIGYYAAARAIAPLSDFAARLDRLRPDEPAPALQPDYARTEVGEIAAAFDRYRDQLAGFVAREREFTANASHELRTPLAVIRNAVELLRVPGLPEERRERVAQRIERATDGMSELVTALLYLARTEQAVSDGGGHDCRVDAVVSEIVEDHRAAAEHKGLRLDVQASEPLTVAAERALVAIVLGNLLENAIRYTDSGGVTVTVAAGSVRIADTGAGIPEHELDRVFKRHYRGGQPVGEAGSGLGLSIARRICDARGWAIGVETGDEGGTTTTVSFRT